MQAVQRHYFAVGPEFSDAYCLESFARYREKAARARFQSNLCELVAELWASVDTAVRLLWTLNDKIDVCQT